MKYETVNHKCQYQKHFSGENTNVGGSQRMCGVLTIGWGVKDIAGRY